ncbi:MAG: hypothetical protein ACOX7F_06185 [Eubacteriales bacterium]|jgi:hypothetical protein
MKAMKALLLHDWLFIRRDIKWLAPVIVTGILLVPGLAYPFLSYLLGFLPMSFVRNNIRCGWYDRVRCAGIPPAVWLGERYLLCALSLLLAVAVQGIGGYTQSFNGAILTCFVLTPSFSLFNMILLHLSLFLDVVGAALTGVLAAVISAMLLASTALPLFLHPEQQFLSWVLPLTGVLLLLDLVLWRHSLRLYRRSPSFDPNNSEV